MEGTITTVSKKLGADKAEIYSKSVNYFDDLKIIAFIIDLLKDFIVSIIKTSTTKHIKCINIDDDVIEGVALGISVAILIIMIVAKALAKCIEDKKRAEESGEEKKCEIFLYCFLNSLMVIAIICYFIGDNLAIFAKINKNSNIFRMFSQILLIAGVLGFRYLPIFKGYIYKYYNRDVDPNSDDDQTAKSVEGCINKTKDCYKKTKDLMGSGGVNIIRRSIALVPEADAIYTLFENIFTKCSGVQKAGAWAATIAIPAVLTPYVGAQTLSILSKIKSEGKKWLKTIITMSITSLLLLSFTISDNQKVLNCLDITECIRINDIHELNALNAMCNTTHIGDEFFNSTTNKIVIGTECSANNKARIMLQILEIALMTVLVLLFFAIEKICKDKKEES